MLKNLKQRLNQTIPIKYTLAVYLGALLLFSSWALAPLNSENLTGLGDLGRFGTGLFIAAAYAGLDLGWTYARERVWYLPLSSIISGFILALVAIPDPPLWLLLSLPILAVFSKQVIHFGRIRHIFNPAAFALGAVALFTPAVSWWGVAWGQIPLAITLIAGIMILWRMERWHITLPFFISYALFLVLLFNLNGIPLSKIGVFLKPQILDGTAIFFATVMLIEPITSQFPTRQNRIVYGILVGFFAVLMTWLASILVLERLDPLIYGLLLGNLTAGLLFLKKIK